MNKPHWSDILLAASRGSLHRFREKGHWKFRINGQEIRPKSVFELMRSGLLEPSKLGPPYVFYQPIEITVRGRSKLMEVSNG